MKETLTKSNVWDVVVVGAGAAGLLFSAKAAKKGLSVLLVEQNKRAGNKILISGGGRCNFTNEMVGPENFYSSNRHFAKSALMGFTPSDFIELVESANIEYYEKTLGQLFCKKSSRQIVDMLLSFCLKHKVQIQYKEKIIKSYKEDDIFVLESENQKYLGHNLVLATGGPSFEKLGGNHSGYKMAKSFGHKTENIEPALVPLTFKGNELKLFQSLSGVSLNTIVKWKKIQFQESTLFTHKGLSGPAILKISLYWPGPPEKITINWYPKGDIEELLVKTKQKEPKTKVLTFLKSLFPNSFAEAWMSHFLPEKEGLEMANISKKDIRILKQQINEFQCSPNGTEGYPKAEVTRGGISCDELSSKTMESKICSGLYVIGELVDVTGWLGGYNFQWAWSSAHAAAQSIAKRSP